MKKTNILLLTLGLLGSSNYIYAGGDVGTPLEPFVDMPVREIEYQGSPFVFMSGGASFSDLSYKKELNSRFDSGVFDTNSLMLEIGAGYNLSENLFTTIAYQALFFDKKQMNNLYSSINYKFGDEELLNMFVGALFGVSWLTWDSDPHLVLIDKSLTSTSFIYGAQAGISKEIKDNISIIAKYQFVKYEHILDVRNDRSSIQHNFGQNILTGVQYAF